MNPADLLDADKLPAELRWLADQHRLQPNDPVFLLLAWHWDMTKRTDESVRASVIELKTVLDGRLREAKDIAAEMQRLSSAVTALCDIVDPPAKSTAAKFIEDFSAEIGTAREQIARLRAEAEQALSLGPSTSPKSRWLERVTWWGSGFFAGAALLLLR